MNIKHFNFFLPAICCFAILPSAADADIIVDVQDTTIDASGTGFVDVLISSTGTDSLDLASYVFGISNVGAPSSSLEFDAVQLTSENGDGNYVFAPDLDVTALDFTVVNPTTIEGSDFTFNGGGVPLMAATRLLARLELQHVLGGGQTAASAAGEQFRITLLSDPNTFFEDENFNPLTVDASSFLPLGTGGGLVTVTAAAVPEPGTIFASGLLAFGVWYRRRKTSTAC